ncbi:MAG: S-methyl-5-thioribose-1-phosphate isomerase [Chloroherpetonaceae bacterium]|nr:S-methyl-5-thioribose-1-phosphate isomerase [Chloroherpetonaceae bacterium]
MIEVIRYAHQRLSWIDQRFLPLKEMWVETNDYRRVIDAIKTLAIRGAPLIGVAAAYTAALGAYSFKGRKKEFGRYFYKMIQELESSRPTAVNLFYASNLIRKAYEELSETHSVLEVAQAFESIAEGLHRKEIENCDRMSDCGAEYLERRFREKGKRKLSILTHCNTGALATGGNGTALGVIKEAYLRGIVDKVYTTETRPLGQGLRLTAWELLKEKIPFYSISDSSAAFLMQKGLIDCAITGADRIAKNGDTANKIGTYSHALCAVHHQIPFFIAAPISTFDFTISDGSEIVIEERDGEELRRFKHTRLALERTPVLNYAFDVTPVRFIEAFFTEEGVILPKNLNELSIRYDQSNSFEKYAPV